MKAIFKKELRSYFLSPIGYVFMSVYIFLSAFFFINGSVAYASANVKALFSNVNIIFLFLISILTMKSFSEEKNKKTEQLLLTAPIKVSEIVLGKYFAALCVFLISLAVSLVMTAVLFIFGDPPLGECIGGYIGFILLWASLIAVGIFISALTESQIISAIYTFAALLLLSYFDFIAAKISNKAVSAVFSSLAVFDRFNDFSAGLLNITNIVFFISFIFVFLFLTVKVIEKKRYA